MPHPHTPPMQHHPLMIAEMFEHGVHHHPKQKIISHLVEGDIIEHTYSQISQRTKQLAHALQRLGVKKGDTVTTLAWNTHRHLEAYFAISGIGAVIHTINPRLFEAQLLHIINDAAAKVLLIDTNILPIIENLLDQCPHIEHIVALTDPSHMPADCKKPLLCYETLLAKEPSEIQWPVFDENTPSALCYTSGTTGNPKGALYTHRSIILHTLASQLAIRLSSTDNVLLVVPLFHVNAWGTPYTGLLTGARLSMPGPHVMGENFVKFIQKAQPNMVFGVPTVLTGLVDTLAQHGLHKTSLRKAILGGSAHNPTLHAKLKEHGILSKQAWGMTELSPIGTFPSDRDGATFTQGVGKSIYLMRFCIQNDAGQTLPNDGKHHGHLMVRSPFCVDTYYKQNASALEKEWFPTGDVARIHPDGEVVIVDRSKDMIKSGGEWISSIDIENKTIEHPKVQAACCIGIPHPKWEERPLLLVIASHSSLHPKEVKQHLSKHFAKWQLPDAVVFIDTIPLTATGKIDKKQLRAAHTHHYKDQGNQKSA